MSKNKVTVSSSSDDKKYIPEDSINHNIDSHGGAAEGHRPRNLGVLDSLFHLDADWGTSLAYILPLSLALTGRLAPIYMIIIAFIMFIVANGYKVVCKHNPDGGGVYSSLKKVNKFLAVVGALLLITDYIVTEALSVSDSYHYLKEFGIDNIITSPVMWTIGILILLTIINWRGPHFSAKFAGIASSATFFLAGILAIAALPLVPEGLRHLGEFNQSVLDLLRNTVGVLLALSGVEAISNMTGIMRDPEKTSRRAINLELIKVVFTTVVLGIAMNAMPISVIYHTPANSSPEEIKQYEADGYKLDTEKGYYYREEERNDLGCVIGKVYSAITHNENTSCQTVRLDYAQDNMLVQMGKYLSSRYGLPEQVGIVYGALIGIAYALLLIFAGNTALIDITNVTFALARDGELPKPFTKLNKKYGVPIWGLFAAGIIPIIVVLIVGANIENLAALYAIGVVGAVTMNLAGTSLQVQGGERITTLTGAIVMAILLVTLVLNKMEATIFAGIVLIIGLSARAIQKALTKDSQDSTDQSISNVMPAMH